MRGPFTRFKLAIALAATLAAAAASAQSVEGSIKGNGKVSKITWVGAVPGDAVEAEGPAIGVVLAEKAPKGAFSLDALREGAQGNYVVSTIATDELRKRHDEFAHNGMRVSVINYGAGGFLDAENLKLEGGKLSGRIFTTEPYDFMGEAVEADVTFSVAAPE